MNAPDFKLFASHPFAKCAKEWGTPTTDGVYKKTQSKI